MERVVRTSFHGRTRERFSFGNLLRRVMDQTFSWLARKFSRISVSTTSSTTHYEFSCCVRIVLYCVIYITHSHITQNNRYIDHQRMVAELEACKSEVLRLQRREKLQRAELDSLRDSKIFSPSSLISPSTSSLHCRGENDDDRDDDDDVEDDRTWCLSAKR